MTQIQGIAPIYCVRNIPETTTWYQTHLNFLIEFANDDYAIISKDGFSIHLMHQTNPEILAVTANNIEFFVSCNDIDTYFDEVMATKPKTQVNPLADRPWGNREFHIKDPNGALLRIGKLG